MNGRVWTDDDNRKLFKLYPDHPTEEIATLLGRSKCATYGQAKKIGTAKSEEFLAKFCRMQKGSQIGKETQFVKGQYPPNKGMRRPGWSVGRMRETQFRKGQSPKNILPVGTIKANADGYLRIKVSDAPEPAGQKGAASKNWEFVHRRVWEAAYGPIAPGHRIWWRDKDHTNNKLENLELLTDKEHMRRTTIHNLPPELKDTIQLAGRVKRAIRKRVKNDASQKQS
jgi:hypothetical protein